jgi:hypothetical protein
MAKKTTELAEEIETFLNTRPEGFWTGMTIGPEADIQVSVVFDPTTLFEKEQKGIYVIPVVREYNIDSSQGRRTVMTVNSNLTIVVCVYYPFSEDELDPNNKDVASWEAVKSIIDLREELERAIIKHTWGVRISNVEAEAAENIPMGKRAYFSPTMFTFEDHC